MGKGRLEGFSDVIAIIITIMVLEMKVLHGESLRCCARCFRSSSAMC